jgi:hypothetical protein
MRNFPTLKMPRKPRECSNIQTTESNKAPSQPIGWNPGRMHRKTTMDESRTQICEPNPNNERKERVQRPDIVREILNLLGSIEMEDEVKNELVTIIKLVTNSGKAKAMVRHQWKAIEIHEQHYSKIQRDSTNYDCSLEL